MFAYFHKSKSYNREAKKPYLNICMSVGKARGHVFVVFSQEMGWTEFFETLNKAG